MFTAQSGSSVASAQCERGRPFEATVCESRVLFLDVLQRLPREFAGLLGRRLVIGVCNVSQVANALGLCGIELQPAPATVDVACGVSEDSASSVGMPALVSSSGSASVVEALDAHAWSDNQATYGDCAESAILNMQA